LRSKTKRLALRFFLQPKADMRGAKGTGVPPCALPLSQRADGRPRRRLETGMEIPPGADPPEGAPIVTWDPPHRLVIRMESPDGTFNALDYAVEARDGGTAHLRYVHSGILADGWEDQYDAIDGHTDFYLHTLRQYLEHFNGRK